MLDQYDDFIKNRIVINTKFMSVIRNVVKGIAIAWKYFCKAVYTLFILVWTPIYRIYEKLSPEFVKKDELSYRRHIYNPYMVINQ